METTEKIADRDWYVRARVRILADCRVCAVDPPTTRTFRAGDEVTLIRWGRAGRPVSDKWWTCQDIDGAHIVPSEYAEILEVLDAVEASDGA